MFKFIHSKCPSINLWRITFFTVFTKPISCSVIIIVGLVESREISRIKPSTFRVMNIPKKLQAAMSSSFKMEVEQISLFCLPHFLLSLVLIYYSIWILKRCLGYLKDFGIILDKYDVSRLRFIRASECKSRFSGGPDLEPSVQMYWYCLCPLLLSQM